MPTGIDYVATLARLAENGGGAKRQVAVQALVGRSLLHWISSKIYEKNKHRYYRMDGQYIIDVLTFFHIQI